MQLDCDDPMTDLIEGEVLEKGRSCGMSMEDTEHFLSGFWKELLGVTRIRHWLTFLSVAAGKV